LVVNGAICFVVPFAVYLKALSVKQQLSQTELHSKLSLGHQIHSDSADDDVLREVWSRFIAMCGAVS